MKTEVAVARMFLPVHAHVCSTEASCSLMGPRWLIYPILSYTESSEEVIVKLPSMTVKHLNDEASMKSMKCHDFLIR
jgi:hypothetical protein